jgi:hypothetical protein
MTTISLSENEEDEQELIDESEEVKQPLKQPRKQPKKQQQVENLTEEQYDKITELINANVKGITKTGKLRKQYEMTDKKKAHMEKMRMIQKQRHEKSIIEKEEKQKKQDEEIVTKRINKLLEDRLKAMTIPKPQPKKQLREIKLKEVEEIIPEERIQEEIPIKPSQTIQSRFKIIR